MENFHTIEYKGWNKKSKFWFVLYMIFAKNLPESRRSSFAKKLRHMFASKVCIQVCKTSNIEKGAKFNPGCIIGEMSSIGIDCELDGPVKIGNYVMMGPETIIYTRNHRHDLCTVPMQEQGYENYRPVIINDDVWIGRRVMIMPGVTIEKGCILAAGAVITKDTVPYGIYAGVPAKLIKIRE